MIDETRTSDTCCNVWLSQKSNGKGEEKLTEVIKRQADESI
jgi:hypothetical protein